MEAIEALPAADGPAVFGMHPNAALRCQQQDSLALLGMVLNGRRWRHN